MAYRAMSFKKDGIEFVSKDDNLSPTEKELVDCVVCMPVTQLPKSHVPAHVENCDMCHEDIWVAETSPKNPVKICVFCVPAHYEQVKATEKARHQ
jgi:hypothetical protein